MTVGPITDGSVSAITDGSGAIYDGIPASTTAPFSAPVGRPQRFLAYHLKHGAFAGRAPRRVAAALPAVGVVAVASAPPPAVGAVRVVIMCVG